MQLFGEKKNLKRLYLWCERVIGLHNFAHNCYIMFYAPSWIWFVSLKARVLQFCSYEQVFERLCFFVSNGWGFQSINQSIILLKCLSRLARERSLINMGTQINENLSKIRLVLDKVPVLHYCGFDIWSRWVKFGDKRQNFLACFRFLFQCNISVVKVYFSQSVGD